MKPEDEFLKKSMTVREALRMAFRQDWNLRRQVINLVPKQAFRVDLHISGEIPPELAKQILNELTEEEHAELARTGKLPSPAQP